MRRTPQRFQYKYRESPDPVMGVAEDIELTEFETQTYTEYEYNGEVMESRRVLGRIHEAIEEHEETAHTVTTKTLVLGVEDYVTVDAWIRYDSNGKKCIDDVVGYNIVTVPGRMIHVPQTNERALINYLK
jgi:hypothetical protein